MIDNLLIVIPAIKKNATIPDQLIKKLCGVTLVQRAINTALEITAKRNIYVITDSEEISLICERNNIEFYKDNMLKLNSDNILQKVYSVIRDKKQENILIYRANTPLVDSAILKEAYSQFLSDNYFILTSVKKQSKNLLQVVDEKLFAMPKKEYYKELKAFHIFSKIQIADQNFQYKPFVIESTKSIEIEAYQDWWICEKVLKRKRIVFNIIGSINIGMGHIYRSLSLAHEITDHEILFVCDEKYKLAVSKIASIDYDIIPTNDVVKTIVELKPQLVINDILNTDKKYILELINNGIKVVNFEDLGSGSKYANLVFNELYDEAKLEGSNYFWGYEYMALRDEFYEAKPHSNFEKVKEILITFGGSDQNNLTLVALKSILEICIAYDLTINIVCGGAYEFKQKLENFIKNSKYNKINLTYESGIISKIMEKAQIAISSNGRTIYELADMNIPAIVISHHDREATHNFAKLERGFVNLGVYDQSTISKSITKSFAKLIEDDEYRYLLFLNIKQYNFRDNKQKIIKKILELL